MTVAAVDAQTLIDATGLGAVYALMAAGIGLFGVLRLINFAYGQLIMVGAYTLAFTASWPVAASIAACFVVVVALSTVMDRVVFRPLRGESPAVMLVTTFAIAFSCCRRGAARRHPRRHDRGDRHSIASFNQPIEIGSLDVRKITILAVIVTALALALLAAPLDPDDHRLAHARRGDGLQHGTPAGSQR